MQCARDAALGFSDEAMLVLAEGTAALTDGLSLASALRQPSQQGHGSLSLGRRLRVELESLDEFDEPHLLAHALGASRRPNSVG